VTHEILRDKKMKIFISLRGRLVYSKTREETAIPKAEDKTLDVLANPSE
jgi:hypothetical protein